VLEWHDAELSRARLGGVFFDDLVAMIRRHEAPEDGGVELRLN
jgi:hypothetical protein